MTTTIDFEGKVALVTGAASGIGAAAAKAFGASGATVIAADISAAVAETVAEIVEAGGNAHAVEVNVSSSAECKTMVDKAIELGGKLDFAFNNAGIGGEPTPLHEMTDESWDEVIAINLSSVFYCIRSQIPAMIKNGGGVIINTSSICGVRPLVDFGHYVAAKHGIVGLTRQTALEYAGQGIRSIAVGPGFIDTQMTKRTLEINPQTLAGLEQSIPQGRIGKPEDIGHAVRMLCSDDAAYINGVYSEIDGGMLLV